MSAYYAIMLAAFIGLALWITYRLTRATHLRKNARATYFDAVKPLFDIVQTRAEPTGFPRMTGHLRGLAFDLQALPDSLTFRKLPALWVMLSMPSPLPVRFTLDIMTRPTGAESFSHFTSLKQTLPCPNFFPEGTVIHCNNATALPPEALIARYAEAFTDPRVKELLISPKGLRIVILAEEADRGRYLIFRDTEMAMTPLAPSRIVPLLTLLQTLRRDLAAWAEEAA